MGFITIKKINVVLFMQLSYYYFMQKDIECINIFSTHETKCKRGVIQKPKSRIEEFVLQLHELIK